jgi:hypothetical protein
VGRDIDRDRIVVTHDPLLRNHGRVGPVLDRHCIGGMVVAEPMSGESSGDKSGLEPGLVIDTNAGPGCNFCGPASTVVPPGMCLDCMRAYQGAS